MLLPVCNFGPANSGPSQSIDCELSSIQFLSTSDANFGSYDRAKNAVSVWVKRESVSSLNQMIYAHTDGVNDRAFDIFFQNDDTLRWRISQNGSTANSGELITTASYASTSAFYHLLFWFDSANVVAGDRMRMWVNGVEVTSFSADTNPTAAMFNSTSSMCVGAQNAVGDSPFDGLIYQASFFSGTLPNINTLYDAGSPMDVTGLPGLWSTLDVAGGVVTHDGVLVSSWTNNNGATASSIIP